MYHLWLGGNGRLRQTQRQSCLWVVAFNSIPETSRRWAETCIWAIWRGTRQFGGQIWTAQAASRSIAPGRQVSSSHLLVDLVVYQYAKFGALNQRIYKSRSSENLSGWLPREQYPRFWILPTIWLSNLFPMFPRASRTIMDNILHLSSAKFPSWLRELMRPQPCTLDWNFH